MPVNVINSGIGGITAKGSLERIDRDVLRYHPDLIVICFGLNDINNPIEKFLDSLEIIFKKCTQICQRVIYMSPNMLDTYVAEDTPKQHLSYAKKTAEYQNSGKMDEYINRTCELARKGYIVVCDVYAQWKKLKASGVDTT